MAKTPQKEVRARLLLAGVVTTFLLVAAAVGAAKDGVHSDSPIPPDKQAELDKGEAALAAESALPRVTTPPDVIRNFLVPEEVFVDPGAPAGAGAIFQRPPQDYPRSRYAFVNFWREEKDGNKVSIYAGRLAADVEQGLVVVGVSKTGAYGDGVADRRNGRHVTAVKAGGLRVVSAVGEQVALLSTSGVVFIFDVAEGRFISPYLEPLPTLNPLPSPVSTPPNPLLPIGLVAIDMDVNGSPANSATSIGSVETCGYLAYGQRLDVDVVVATVPPVIASEGGILGVEFKLHYDTTMVKVTASNPRMLVAAAPGSSPFTAGDGIPDTDGVLYVAVLDTNANATESGAGVLARITLEGTAQLYQAGEQHTGTLTLSDISIISAANNVYPLTEVHDAKVKAGLLNVCLPG